MNIAFERQPDLPLSNQLESHEKSHEDLRSGKVCEFPNEMVARVGIEPTTHGFSVRCSTS